MKKMRQDTDGAQTSKPYQDETRRPDMYTTWLHLYTEDMHGLLD
jgi:hypothetical protein